MDRSCSRLGQLSNWKPATTTKLERLERVVVGLMAGWNARPNGRRKFGVRWSAKSSPSRNAAGKSNADESQDKERRFGCRCLAIKNKGLIDGGTCKLAQKSTRMRHNIGFLSLPVRLPLRCCCDATASLRLSGDVEQRGGKSRETEPVLLPICSLDSYVPTFFVSSSRISTHDETGINLYSRLVLAQSKLPPKLAPCGNPGDGRGPRNTSGQLFGAIPIFAGHNDAQGNFVPDTPPPAPFDAHPGCGFYYDLFAQMPGGLVNTTGIFKKNVDILSTHANMLRNGIQANVDSAPGKIWSWDSAMRRDQSTYAAHYSKNKCAWEQHRQYACSEFESTLEERKLTTDVPTTTCIIFGVLSSHLSRDEATALYPKSAWALMGVSKSA
ncbi:hypothetical protein C8J57DRAFT_1478970 [Mycena rebaudengoi]|nr:hypothetical protein C8J57DRAFT_1478970 [Mycena rebaudengoi]